jgi:hypothetical protein
MAMVPYKYTTVTLLHKHYLNRGTCPVAIFTFAFEDTNATFSAVPGKHILLQGSVKPKVKTFLFILFYFFFVVDMTA